MLEMSKIQKAGNEVSDVLERNGLKELEALMALEFVRISIQTAIMRKAGAFIQM